MQYNYQNGVNKVHHKVKFIKQCIYIVHILLESVDVSKTNK